MSEPSELKQAASTDNEEDPAWGDYVPPNSGVQNEEGWGLTLDQNKEHLAESGPPAKTKEVKESKEIKSLALVDEAIIVDDS